MRIRRGGGGVISSWQRALLTRYILSPLTLNSGGAMGVPLVDEVLWLEDFFRMPWKKPFLTFGLAAEVELENALPWESWRIILRGGMDPEG